jgi:ABC-type bacteriocin/lantibiotic exporter with double-glycine peptidase domain
MAVTHNFCSTRTRKGNDVEEIVPMLKKSFLETVIIDSIIFFLYFTILFTFRTRTTTICYREKEKF